MLLRFLPRRHGLTGPLGAIGFLSMLVTLSMFLLAKPSSAVEAREPVAAGEPVVLTLGAPLPHAAPAPWVSPEERLRARAELLRAGSAGRTANASGEKSAPGDRVNGVPDEAGGDDVLIMTHPTFGSFLAHSIDIAENGDIYVAIEVDEQVTSGAEIRVYRSQDQGDTWQLWGSKSDADPESHFREPVIHVAEGNQNRVFLAYIHRTDDTHREISVSSAPIPAAGAVWTDRVVMDSLGVDFEFPDLSSDAEVNGAYRLFVVATGLDSSGNGDDIWFASSSDFGATWQTEFRMAVWSLGDADFWFPRVRYGKGGIVHFTWQHTPRLANFGQSVFYRRAYNFGATFADFADTTWIMTSTGNAQREYEPVVAASHASDRVVIVYQRADTLDGFLRPPGVVVSDNAGFFFRPNGGETIGQTQSGTEIVALPGTAGFRTAGEDWLTGFGAQSATDADPFVWSPMDILSDRDYWDFSTHRVVLDYNQTKSNGIGLIWQRLSAGNDSLFFDAEWRDGPGYPNLEAGFPVAVPAGAVSPPAICELDGDVEGEIVYGDANGFIQAYNHDGTIVPGWPIDIGTIPPDSPVAIGDLDGDGRNEVVCGNSVGLVHAFRNDGTVLPGWPVNVGISASTYVAIGAVLPGSNRQVAAAAGNRLTLLYADGTTAPSWPSIKTASIVASPAIGDVDNDGDQEIVVVFGGFVNVMTGGAAVQSFRNLTGAGKSFSNAPTLGDINLDADLEIVAPTDQGDVYVLNPDGTDLTGWPYTDPLGSRITSVALAQARSGFEPELGFAVENATTPTVHARSINNAELTGYPKATGAGWLLLGAPIWEVLDQGSSDLVIGSRDRFGWAWDNFGSELPGWPEPLGGAPCNVSPASGDLDQDGKVEVVFVTSETGRLFVFDLGAAIQRDTSRRIWFWPMYGYNPQRTGCLACEPDDIVAAGSPRAGRVTFAPPAPNPTAGALAFRFALPDGGAVRLALYDVAGRTVRDLMKAEMPAGEHQARWDGRGNGGAALAPGIYYARLTVADRSGETVEVRKVTLLR